MRKLSLAVLFAIAFMGLAWLMRPIGPSTAVDQTNPNASYAALFNRKRAEFPSQKDLAGINKRMRPDMFYLHDKLQRMDPRTGEVPADGYMRAYSYIQETWGNILPTESSGNALVWEARGPGGIGGRTRALLWDPNDANNNAVFAGGVGGGLWRTANVTTSSPVWTMVSPVYANVAVTCINHDPSNPQILYYGTGEGYNNADAIRGAGVFKSTDGGNTWALLPSTATSEYYYCQDIAVTPDGNVYVATKNGLWRSTNGGTTFAKALGSGTGLGNDFITDLEVGANGDLFAAISGGGIYRSLASLGANQGLAGNWTRLQMTFPAGYGRIEFEVANNNPSYMYAVAEVSQATSPIYRSTNAGASWAATTGQPENGATFANDQAWYDLTLEVDPNDHLKVYTGGIDTYRSTNGGTSWTQLTAAYGGSQPYMHPDQHNIVVCPNNSNRVIFGNDGGVHYSSASGSSPAARNSNYNITQFYSLAIDPRSYSNILIGGTQDNGSIMVNQPGIGQGIDLTGADGSYSAINPLYPDTMFTTSQFDPVYRSRNGGANFSYIGNLNLDESNTLFINPIEIDPANPNTIYQGSTSLWRNSNASSGGSGSWMRATASVNSLITAIAPSKIPANLVYFASGGTVYRLPNANSSNSSTVPGTVNPSGAGAGYIQCILVNPNDGNHILITYASFNVTKHIIECRNADQGANAVWKDLSGNLPNIPCNWAAFEPNNPNGILLGTDMGIFRCADITLPSANIYWSPENTGLGLPRVSMIKTKYSNNSVAIATHGLGFFSTSSYNQPPVALFGTGNTMACGGAVQFFDSTSNAPISWSWDFGDGGTSTQQSPVHVFAASGTYTVTLTAGNPVNTDTYTTTVNVTVLPPALAAAGPDINGCVGDSVQLNASGGVSYAWSPTSGLSNPNISNPVLVMNGSRSYVVTVTDANGCTATDTMVVTQQASPSVWAGQDQTISTPGGSVQLQGSGGTTYVWSPATGLSCTNCPNPVASPSTTTVYTCTGYNALGCSRSDNMTVFVTTVGIDNPENAGAVLEAISPNPVLDLARISFSLSDAGPVVIDLVDLQGRTMAHLLHEEKGPGKHNVLWDSKDIASGVYFIRMQAAGQMFSRKLIITN